MGDGADKRNWAVKSINCGQNKRVILAKKEIAETEVLIHLLDFSLYLAFVKTSTNGLN